jgi:hypothetical protein
VEYLHGRQLAVLLAFFASVCGLLVLIGWFTRPSIFWDTPQLAAAIAGAACYPAKFLVENRLWWRRLGGHGVPVVAAADIPRALRRVRRRVLADRIQLVCAALAVILGLTLLPLTIMGEGNPANVFSNTMDWSNPWTDYLIVFGLSLVIGALVAWPLLATIRYPRDARRALARIRSVAATATVVEIQALRTDDEYDEPTETALLLSVDDQTWRLTVEPFEPLDLAEGTQLPLAGNLQNHGWVACLTTPPLKPNQPIERRGT